MLDNLGDDINWKLNNLGWYLPRKTIDALADFLRDRKPPVVSPALAAAAQPELAKRTDPEDPEEGYLDAISDIFNKHGLSVEHKGKVYSTLGINGFFDIIDRAILHSRPTKYRDPARDASVAMRNRMATMAMERLERSRSDEALRSELRVLAAALHDQIGAARAREADLRDTLEVARAKIDAAVASLGGKS